MKPKSTLRSFLLLTGSSLLAFSYASAATYYWDSNSTATGFGATAGIWGTSLFWSTNSAGTATPANTNITNFDDINFGTATNAYSGTVTLSGDKTARTVTFAGSSNVVLLGNGTARRLTIGSGGLTMNDTSTVTMGDGLVAGNNLLIGLGTSGQTWTNNTANNLSILNTADTFTRSAGGTIAFNGTGGFSMSTTVLPNEASGIVGPWAFFGTGTNTRYAYNNSGTIADYSTGTAATDAEAFTSSTTNYDFSTIGNTTLTDNRQANTVRYAGTGNEIDLGASGANTLTTNGILAVGASGTLTIKRTGGTGTLVAGSTGTNSELIIAGPQAIGISAPISNGLGNSALTYSGTGMLTLSGDNTYSGGNTVNSGTLVAGSATALGATGKSINVNGTGTLNLNSFDYTAGAFNGDNGIVTNSGASVKVFSVGSGNTNGAFAGAITGALNLTKVGNGTLTLNGTNTFTGSTTVNAGTISAITPAALGTGSITIAGNSSIAPGYGVYPQFSNALQVDPGVTFTVGSASQFFGTSYNGIVSGSGKIIYGGANDANDNGAIPRYTLSLGNAGNTFTGTLESAGGSANVAVNSLADSANPIILNGGAFILTTGTASSLLFESRQITLKASGGLSNDNATASNTITVNTSLAFSGTGTRTLTLGGANTGSNTFGGIITNNGASAVSLTKSGNGTWVLSGANDYTGSTTVSAGTLSVGSSNNLGAASNSLVFDGGTLRVTGTALSSISGIGHTVSFTAAKTVGLDIENAAHTFTVDQALNQTTGGLTKLGLGKVVLNQTNTYTGATTVNAGTLALGTNDVLGATAVAIGNATLDAATFDDTVGTLDVTANAAINLGSGAALAFAASNGISWTGGTLNITGTFVPGNGVNPGVGVNSGSLRFGISNTGLTATQLGLISASGWTSFALDAYGYLTATPSGPDTTPPTLTNIVDDKSGGPVAVGTLVTYTVTFSEDIADGTVTSADFDNAGSSSMTFGTITETSPGVFTVPVTPTSVGTLILRIPTTASLTDNAVIPNPLDNDPALVDNTTLTVTVADPYAAWAGAGVAFDADANNDGVDNGLAFLLGAASPTAAVTLPTVTQSGGNLTLTFSMLKSANRGTAALTVQHSSDLGITDSWASALVPESTGTVGGVGFTVTPGVSLNAVIATIPVIEAGGSGKLFGRLKATQ